jgi:hypothetical protein
MFISMALRAWEQLPDAAARLSYLKKLIADNADTIRKIEDGLPFDQAVAFRAFVDSVQRG